MDRSKMPNDSNGAHVAPHGAHAAPDQAQTAQADAMEAARQAAEEAARQAAANAARVAERERKRGSGQLDRASFTLAIASLPRDDRYAVLDVIYQVMTGDASEVPAPRLASGLGGWLNEAFSTMFGPAFPPVGGNAKTTTDGIDYDRISQNYAAVDLDGDKRTLEAYIRRAFCACLGLPDSSSAVDVEDALFRAFGHASSEPLATRLEALSVTLPGCFNRITPETVAAIQGDQVVEVYGKVHDSLQTTTVSILDAMPFVSWVLWRNFGARLQDMGSHDVLFDGVRSDECAPGSQFELAEECCAAVMAAERNREEYAQRDAERLATSGSKTRHEKALAYYENVAANYDALVRREEEIISEQVAIEKRERAEEEDYAEKREAAQETLNQIERDNADRLRPYQQDCERAEDDEEREGDALDRAADELDRATDAYNDVQARLNEANADADDLESSIRTEAAKLESEAEDNERMINDLRSRIDQLELDYMLAAERLADIRQECSRQERAWDEAEERYKNFSPSTPAEYDRDRMLKERAQQEWYDWKGLEDDVQEAERKYEDERCYLEGLREDLSEAEGERREIGRKRQRLEEDKMDLQSLYGSIQSLESELGRAKSDCDRAKSDFRRAEESYNRYYVEAERRRGELANMEEECERKRRAQAAIVSDHAANEMSHRACAENAYDTRLEHEEALADIHRVFQNKDTLIPDTRDTIKDETAHIAALESRMRDLVEDNAVQKKAFDERFGATMNAYAAKARSFRRLLNEKLGESLLGEEMEFLTPNDAIILFNTPLESFSKLESDLFRRIQADEYDVYGSLLELVVYDLPLEEVARGFLGGNHASLFVTETALPALTKDAKWIHEASRSSDRKLPRVRTGAPKKLPVTLSMNDREGQPPVLARA